MVELEDDQQDAAPGPEAGSLLLPSQLLTLDSAPARQ